MEWEVNPYDYENQITQVSILLEIIVSNIHIEFMKVTNIITKLVIQSVGAKYLKVLFTFWSSKQWPLLSELAIVLWNIGKLQREEILKSLSKPRFKWTGPDMEVTTINKDQLNPKTQNPNYKQKRKVSADLENCGQGHLVSLGSV